MNHSSHSLKVLPKSLPTSVSNFVNYSLLWRQRKLIVRFARDRYGSWNFPPCSRSDWLVDCLQRSPVKLVKLDLSLGETNLKTWADACHKANKVAYVRLPATAQLPQKQHPFNWRLKRLFDWLIAALLLVLLSPVMVWVALLITWFSPGPIFFYQWRVGERGKLFKIIKFRTMDIGAEQLHHQVMGSQEGLHKLKDDPRITALGRWIRRYSLDELPQLLNVLKGEMSLVGPRPWALYDAIRISPDLQHRLNALPGITGAWQVEARATMRDLSTVNRGDLRYLHGWSLWKDFRFLLLTIPKVIAGFGAY